MSREEKSLTLLGTVGKIFFAEEGLARSVFRDTLPYGHIWLAKNYLKGASAPVTIATSPRVGAAEYVICWGDPNVYNNGVNHSDNARARFIHELIHIWQGHHGYSPMGYMIKTIKGSRGIREIVKYRRYSDLNSNRRKAHLYTMRDIGKPWSSFNAEQQANIIEDWFRSREDKNAAEVFIDGGNRSTDDPRFSYVKSNIRAGSMIAGYGPIVRHPVLHPVLHPPGFSADIAECQKVLYALGYLMDIKYVDGFMSSFTRSAVYAFQSRNGLFPDGELNSPTRAKLKQHPETLRRAQ
ncbi:MAG TPA: peptidoglycan-binding domain-containing protein [Pyrinomonadaceae bacterium]|jgi:hypothetical protein|nr:peptidoglycan-binding domain-containing protein [Pyrinomonadaceae bacterium]